MFKFEDNKCYRMPAHFGGSVFDPGAKATYHDVVTLAFTVTTDGDRLSDYLPEGFELRKPELGISYQQMPSNRLVGGVAIQPRLGFGSGPF